MSFSFTDAQIARMAEVEQEWIDCAFSTDPADRAAAEQSIKEVYRVAKHQSPERILWCQSPFESLMTVAYLRARYWRRLWKSARTRYSDSLWQTFKRNFLANFADSVSEVFWDRIGERCQFRLTAPNRDTEQGGRAWQSLFSRFQGLTEHEQSFNAVVADEFWPDTAEPDELQRLARVSQDGFDRNTTWEPDGGHHDITMSICFACWHDLFGFQRDAESAHAHGKLARSAGMWWAFERLCLIAERPCLIRVDGQQRLHSEIGPALIYPDGWAVHCWHGVRVPRNTILSPDTITVAQIERQRNLEARRVLMERYGTERYLRDSGAHEIQRDQFGVLYRRDFQRQEPLMMLMVTNRTPEPNGSFREYFMRVPPTMNTARQAVAWTFGLRAAEYLPAMES